jgi:hypothetical protein
MEECIPVAVAKVDPCMIVLREVLHPAPLDYAQNARTHRNQASEGHESVTHGATRGDGNADVDG